MSNDEARGEHSDEAVVESGHSDEIVNESEHSGCDISG